MSGNHLTLAERESGIIVPGHLANQPEVGQKVTRDPDGRVRLVLTDEDRRAINRLVMTLQGHGLGAVVACRRDQAHADGSSRCGDIMITEGKDTPDPGYGCTCTRIHWLKP